MDSLRKPEVFPSDCLPVPVQAWLVLGIDKPEVSPVSKYSG